MTGGGGWGVGGGRRGEGGGGGGGSFPLEAGVEPLGGGVPVAGAGRWGAP